FLQVLPGAKSAALKKAVDAKNTILGRFDLEQTGDRLRVVDGDGSVYDGQMIDGAAGGKDQGVAAATGVTRSDALSGKSAAVSPRGLKGVRGVTGTAVGAALRSFRVTGTNRTFRLPVVFEGVVL